MIVKNLLVERVDSDSPEQKSGKMSFVASNASPDRIGDVIAVEGWDISSYEKNNIVLFNHNPQELPIGRGFVSVVEDALMIDIEFDEADPVAKEISRKCREGFLNAVSVGFNPIESINRADLPEDHFAKGSTGLFFTKTELLEVSIVTIPANSQAVAAKNLTPDFFRMMAKHIIEVLEKDDRVVISYAKEQEAGEREEDKKTPETEGKTSSFYDLPVTDESFNPRKQDRSDIENAILSGDNWDRYKEAHLYFDPDQEEAKAGYKFIIGRLRDSDDPEDSAPEKGRLYVFRDQLAAAVAAINGSREKPNLSEEDRKKAYLVAEKYYSKLGLKAPPFKEDLSYSKPEDEEDEEEENGFKSLADLLQVLQLHRQ